jgi:hypothetical protein
MAMWCWTEAIQRPAFFGTDTSGYRSPNISAISSYSDWFLAG